jgi:DNA invertase Pin-like site-specific DNA recombinase
VLQVVSSSICWAQLAQFETEIRAERQREGIQKARERGVRFGKRKTLNPQQVAELQERRRQGFLIKTLMQEYGLSKTSIYRYLKEETDAVGAHRAI